VHVQLLKKYHKQDEIPKVGRATSVFEPDGEGNDILDRYAEVKIAGDDLDEGEKSDIEKLLLFHKFSSQFPSLEEAKFNSGHDKGTNN